MTETERLIEEMAKAIQGDWERRGSPGNEMPWDKLPKPVQYDWQLHACAALRAVLKRYYVVPRKATAEMLKAGAMAKHSSACDGGFSIVGSAAAEPCFRAMAQASPIRMEE